MQQEILLYVLFAALALLLWFLIAALLRSSSAKAGKEIETEKQLDSLTTDMLTVQREQRELTLAQERAAEKLEEVRKRVGDAKREARLAELDLLMKKHLGFDGEIERQTEDLLERLRRTVASLEQMKRLGSELNLHTDFSVSLGFLTDYMAWKMAMVFPQGLPVLEDRRERNVSELDKEFFDDARQQMARTQELGSRPDQ
jgi:chromosome segregation ATPase